MQNIQIQKEIEAILFYLSEPVEFSYIAKILSISKDEVSKEVRALSERLRERGLAVIVYDNTATLTTAPDVSAIIDAVIKDERERDLGRASIETLAIVAYKGPVSRKEIEYIRGVNCQFALRTLLLRGLIERKNKEGGDRAIVYSITTDALMHLGLQDIHELPEYDTIQGKLEVPEEPENIDENG